MSLPEILSLAMFLTVFAVLLLGFPVAFTLAGVALIFAWIGSLLDVFNMSLMGGLASRIFGVMSNELLVAVPLFVFMGVMLERSKLAEQMLETMGKLFGRVRGGLGFSVIIVGMLLAASTGIVGATVVTMGLLSLPTMLRVGYDPKLATGIICSSGTLGQIIPPSIVLVLLGDIMQGANTQAQLRQGQLRPGPGVHGRSVCRRLYSGPGAGRAVHGLAGRDGRFAAHILPGPDRGRGRAHGIQSDRTGAVPPRVPHRRRARLHTQRYCHPHGVGRRGCGGCHAAGREQRPFQSAGAARRHAVDHQDQLHGVHHPGRCVGFLAGVPRAGRGTRWWNGFCTTCQGVLSPPCWWSWR